MAKKKKFVLVVHGGAGNILKENIPLEKQDAYLSGLRQSLQAGYEILREGGSSLDAVEKAINVMEDSDLFNAGKGAVLSHDAINELDASIMDGKTLNAGAVAGVRTIKNPITAARKVLENSEHVMLIGEGADRFAKDQQLEQVDSEYFFSEKRLQQLKNAQEREAQQMGNDKPAVKTEDEKYGTVGAVALDKHGSLAAGNSTGGMTNKRYGRVGDTPIIGSGIYANNKTCAVASTGHGEYFMRYVVAYDVAALMEYKGLGLEAAANEVIFQKLLPANGRGGVIAVDAKGNFSMPFNTPGMYRGYINADGEMEVLMFGE